MREFVLKEVPDWNDEVIATARFKAFSGQRSDWEPKFQFWKNLILKIARHFSLAIIHPSQVCKVSRLLLKTLISHLLSVIYYETGKKMFFLEFINLFVRSLR